MNALRPSEEKKFFDTLRKRVYTINDSARRYKHTNKLTFDEVKADWERRLPDSATCWWCAKELRASNISLDHHIPLAHGGKHSIGNISYTCRRCNRYKKALDPNVWGRLMRTLDEAALLEIFFREYQPRRW